MYRAMVGVGVVCGLLIVGVFQATRPIIERNKAEALRSAIFHVLPDATHEHDVSLRRVRRFLGRRRRERREPQVYAGYDDDHQLVGLAVEAQGMGYQDVIRLIYGYSFVDEAIIGIQVLDSKETPGLGDKIETDPEFLANFERLDVSLERTHQRWPKPSCRSSHGNKTHPWEVDGITGATISSKAIASILDGSAQYWVPRIRRNLERLPGRRVGHGSLHQEQHRRLHQGPLEGEPGVRPGARDVPGAGGLELGKKRAGHGLGNGVRPGDVQRRGVLAATFHPKEVRIATYILVIATFVTVVDYVIQAISLDLYKALGAFISLIVVNCLILGRAEAFASKNTVARSSWTASAWGSGSRLRSSVWGGARDLRHRGRCSGFSCSTTPFRTGSS